MNELSIPTSQSGEIVLYQPDENVRLEVRIEEDTVWLSQQQMTILFQTTKQNVSLHINNIFKEGELRKEATVKDYLTVQSEGERKVNRIVWDIVKQVSRQKSTPRPSAWPSAMPLHSTTHSTPT